MSDATTRIRALNEAAGGPGGSRDILGAMEDDNSLVREHAVALAARHLSPETLGALVREEANATLRNSALSALERQGPYAVAHLTTLAADDDLEVVMFAVQVLSRIREPSTIQALLPLMEHADLNIAQAAVEALGNMRAPEAVHGLIQLLHADIWLQVAAVGALGEIADARAVPHLLDLLDDEMLAMSVTEALAHIASPDAVRPLADLVIDGDRLPLRDGCLTALARTLEQHDVPREALAQLRRAVAANDTSGPTEYLRGLLVSDNRQLARDAAILVAASELASLYPELVLRTADSEEATWTAALCRRHAACARGVLALGHSSDPHVRRGALLVGATAPGARELALSRLDDPDERVRAAACRALGQLADPDLVPELVRAFDSDSSEEHYAACEGLGRMPAASLTALSSYLEPNASGGKQLAALRVLEVAHGGVLVPQMRLLTRADSPAVRRAAVRALATSQSAPSEALLPVLDDPDEAVRIEAVEALARAEVADAGPRLVQILAEAQLTRYHAIRALGRLRAACGADALIELYPRALPHERIEIVSAVGRIARPGVMDFLRERLGEDEVAIRRVAADNLARLCKPGDLALLEELARDDDWNLRNHAAWGLGRLGVPAARDTLMELVRDVEPVVTRTARTALGKLTAQA